MAAVVRVGLRSPNPAIVRWLRLKLQRVTCYLAQLAEDLCDRDDGHNAWVKVCAALACKGLPRLAAELRLVKRT